MLLNYFHGEGIVFSFLIQAFFFFAGAVALLFGLLKYKSLIGAATAIVYLAATVLIVLLSQKSFMFETFGWLLTLPWNLVVPCYNGDSTCPLRLAVAFICAELNAAVFYFLIAWLSRLK